MGNVWIQQLIELEPRPRGFHLVTREIVSELDLSEIEVGGIYLCEHRDHGGSRRVVATAWGREPAR